MALTQAAERAALNKIIDYLDEDPEKNIDTIMTLVDKFVPEYVLPSQRRAFDTAIRERNNWYRLMMRIFDLNPEVRTKLLKTLIVDCSVLAWPQQERMREKHQCNIPYAILLDPTSACNLRCTGCWAAEYGHALNLSFEDIDSIICQGKELGCHIYIYTGGEPLVRKGVVDLIREINDIPEIEDISLTTNGILLPKMAPELREAGLTRVNISLDTLDPAQFSYVTRLGKIEDVFAGIDAAFEHGFDPVKINAVAVRGLDQDFFAFAKLTLDRPLHVRFIEYMPVGESSGCSGAGWTEDDIIPASEIIERINEGAAAAGIGPLEPVDDESLPSGAGPAIYYRLPGAQGTVGFISAMSNHFCASCNRLRLTSDGKLRPCLFSDREIDVMGPIRAGDEGAVDEAIREAIGIKPDEHHEERGTERRMSQIGG